MNMFPEHARKTEINGKEILYWNTQRYYSSNGQRIVAVQFGIGDLPEKDVLFLDLDRCIDGIIPNCPLKEYAIMDSYDKNNYHPVGNQDEYCTLRDLFKMKDEIVKLFGEES